jgi:hypothetical protein
MDIEILKKVLKEIDKDHGYIDGDISRIENYILQKKTNHTDISFLKIADLLHKSDMENDKLRRMMNMAMEELEKYITYREDIYINYAVLNLAEAIIVLEEEEKRKQRLIKDRTGMRYGKLVVLGPGGTDKRGRRKWWVRCDCGTEKEISGSYLIKTKSCGCLQREAIRNYNKSRQLPNNTKQFITVEGKRMSLKEASEVYGVKRGTIRQRLLRGLTIKDALLPVRSRKKKPGK